MRFGNALAVKTGPEYTSGPRINSGPTSLKEANVGGHYP
jgi:hypothetical protein